MPTGKVYRPYHPHQDPLLPPSLQEWLPHDHGAYFVRDLVEHFDLSASEARTKTKGGAGPLPPPEDGEDLAVRVLHGCLRVAPDCPAPARDAAVRVLAAENTPDFRTISEFRRRHLEALSGLFRQALAQQAGLVTLGHAALDGTKIRATAGKHKAMSYARLCQEEPRLAAEVAALVRRAEEADAVDDAAYGPDRSGDEVPEELRRRESRVRKIREA